MLHRPGVIPLLGSQAWVAHVRQLAGIGVSRQSVADAVRRGALEQVMSRVVGLPGHWDTFEGRCMVAQLAAGPTSYLSGTTAARLLGLRQMPVRPIRVTVDETLRVRLPDWAVLCRTSWPDAAQQLVGPHPLRVSTPARMLFDLAALLPDARFRRAAEDAWHRELITPAEAANFLQQVRRQGRTGVARFEAWLDGVMANDQVRPAESGLEQLLVELARRAGLPEPVRQYPLTLVDGRTIRLDLAWPDTRFAIEPGHSWWHGGDLAQRADQERDRQCAIVGWQVVRYDESVWTRRDATVGEIASMYRSRCRDVG